MGEKLTRRRIESWLRNPTAGEWLWCGELRGFGIQRRGDEAGDSAAYVAQFRVGRGRLAKRRRTVIGQFPALTPEAARLAAADLINAGRNCRTAMSAVCAEYEVHGNGKQLHSLRQAADLYVGTIVPHRARRIRHLRVRRWASTAESRPVIAAAHVHAPEVRPTRVVRSVWHARRVGSPLEGWRARKRSERCTAKRRRVA
jgi:hypothetical protein